MTPLSLPVNEGITMGEARAHYTDMVEEERKEAFLQAHADQGYNLCLLDEHLLAEEQLRIRVTADVHMAGARQSISPKAEEELA